MTVTPPPEPWIIHCPVCTATAITFDGMKEYTCQDCGWVFFHNPAPAVAGIITVGEALILTIRNRAPGKGLWDLPGGFVDPGETGEEALRRECQEELNLPLSNIRYFASWPNLYHYKHITYPTLDIFYTASATQEPSTFDPGELAGVFMTAPHHIDLDKLAFHSMKVVLKQYLTRPAL